MAMLSMTPNRPALFAAIASRRIAIGDACLISRDVTSYCLLFRRRAYGHFI